MFKLVVLSVVLAVAASAPAPGYLHGGYALPAATSYSSRIDVHSKPLITTYAEPVVAKTIVASPISYAYPAVSHGYGIHAPIVSGYGLGYDHGYGIGHGYGYGHGW
ncbi:cuticle protein 63-like [Tribolium madens]|uniref:cuticle protein 63-like n=1 Tax=Tribolium madens TaxID=41895 RepID=UPI001CF73F54|nr:cuticle protein 63-like [Tribolium madens]